MAVEIERKFLIDRERCPLPAGGEAMKQGYVPTAASATVRVRVASGSAFLTLKGETRGVTRSEFEYPIPVADAEAILDELCRGRAVEKTRYTLPFGGHLWEVDIFEGDNLGLCVAEVELESEDEALSLPTWVTEEVTGDPSYYNASLVDNPYRNWRE